MRAAHVPVVVVAMGRWLFGTRGGRKVLAVGIVIGVAATVLAAKRREGTWSGLENEYAPRSGDFVLDGSKCRIHGRAGIVSGNGWVFKGTLSVDEVTCEARTSRDGKVSGGLKFEEKWDGRVKGIGGDWEDRSGNAICEGDIDGTVSGGGTWKGTCAPSEGQSYASSLTWTLRGE